jgi:hypothetical protein
MAVSRITKIDNLFDNSKRMFKYLYLSLYSLLFWLNGSVNIPIEVKGFLRITLSFPQKQSISGI